MDSDAAAARIAIDQGGVIRLQQAIDSGLTFRQVRLRVQRGAWTQARSGVYRLFESDSPAQLARAAVAALPGAVVSHSSAVELHDLERAPRTPPTVSVHSRTTHVFPGVVVRRCHDLAGWHVTTIRSTSVTTVARTLVDLARDLSPRHVGSILDSAVASRKTTIEETEAVLRSVARRGKPGIRTMRAVLEDRLGEPPHASVLERRGQRLLRSAGIRGFRIEYPIPWATNRRFDIAFPDEQVAVEWDSRRWHTRLDSFDEDRRRDRECAIHGWTILRFTWNDIRDRSDEISAAVRSVVGDRHVRSVG